MKQCWPDHLLEGSPSTANRTTNSAGHGAVLERVQHLEIAAGLAPLEVGDVLPETIDTREGHQPLRVELPGVPASGSCHSINLNSVLVKEAVHLYDMVTWTE